MSRENIGNETACSKKREIRPLTQQDIEAYLDIYLNSYPAYKSLDAECRQHYREKHQLELREDREVQTVGLFEDGILIATMKLVSFSMNFFGKMQPACGLMALEVHPLHKKKGAALEMVRYFEAYAKENGALLTLLLPFKIGFYRQMGYGFAGKLYEYHLPTAVLPKMEDRARQHLRLMQPEDFDEALACYNRFAARNHGMVKKFEEEVLSGEYAVGDMEYSSYYKDSFKRLKKNKMSMFCLFVILLLILIAIFAPLLAPYDPTVQDYASILQGPSKQHLLGTDEYGRDILSRIIYGTRISLSVGILAQVIATIIGVTMGSLAAYYGGWVDTLISRIMEIFAAFPDLIFAMAIMYVLGAGMKNIFVALGLLTWVRTARMIRGSILQLKEKEYVEAAKASGASPFYIITRHLIPNCISTIIVLVTLGIPNAIMYEASLSFLGLGIQPPTPSWGSMISFAQSYISYLPGYSIFPGLAIMITVIAFNIFGDGLRDALDPKMKNQ